MLLLAGLASAAVRPPNVIMSAVDDMNDWIGPMGQRHAVTPNLDRLACKGVTFHNALAAASFCTPSRSALFTGRYAPRTGCYTTQVFFHDHPEIKPLQTVLNDGGYATYGSGKLFHHRSGYVDLHGLAPSSFAAPGAEVHELRLVMEDERFHWQRKPIRDSLPQKPRKKR